MAANGSADDAAGVRAAPDDAQHDAHDEAACLMMAEFVPSPAPTPPLLADSHADGHAAFAPIEESFALSAAAQPMPGSGLLLLPAAAPWATSSRATSLADGLGAAAEADDGGANLRKHELRAARSDQPRWEEPAEATESARACPAAVDGPARWEECAASLATALRAPPLSELLGRAEDADIVADVAQHDASQQCLTDASEMGTAGVNGAALEGGAAAVTSSSAATGMLSAAWTAPARATRWVAARTVAAGEALHKGILERRDAGGAALALPLIAPAAVGAKTDAGSAACAAVFPAGWFTRQPAAASGAAASYGGVVGGGASDGGASDGYASDGGASDGYASEELSRAMVRLEASLVAPLSCASAPQRLATHEALLTLAALLRAVGPILEARRAPLREISEVRLPLVAISVQPAAGGRAVPAAAALPAAAGVPEGPRASAQLQAAMRLGLLPHSERRCRSLTRAAARCAASESDQITSHLCLHLCLPLPLSLCLHLWPSAQPRGTCAAPRRCDRRRQRRRRRARARLWPRSRRLAALVLALWMVSLVCLGRSLLLGRWCLRRSVRVTERRRSLWMKREKRVGRGLPHLVCADAVLQ